MSEASTAKKYWRSLNELENSPEFEEMLHREFPVAASEFPQGISRRRWLQLMGASLALGGLTGCRYKEEKFAPLSARPVDRIPGRTDRYATSIELAGGVRHLLVTCYDGRPLKVEGNAEHPAGQRGTDAWAQACILEMYDPDRGSTVRQRSGKQAVTRQWSDFDQVIGESLNSWKAAAGEGLAVLFEPTESIALRAMLESLQTAFPKVRLYQHASISRDNAVQGSQLAFGKSYRTHLVLDKAEVIVSLDADLLVDHPAALRLAKDFAAGRDADKGSMNRLYVVESQFTVTGASADHRLAVRSSDIGRVLSEIERLVDEHLEEKKVHVDASADKREHLVQAIADDLVSHPGRAVIAVGLRQPPEVHARVHRLNARLQNAGQTVRYTEEEDLPSGDLKSLIAEIDAGNVKTALILGGNPVYDSPADIDVAGALAKLENSVHLSVYENETSEACQWYLPGTHAFEAWGDARAWDGTISVTQPLIEPVLGGRSALQLLAQLCGDDREPQQIVRSVIEQAHGQPLTDDQWRRFLHDGYLDGSRFAPAEAAPAEAAGGGRGREQRFRRRRRLGSRLLYRRFGVRRPFCEQRVAAGDAAVLEQADMGQRGDRQPRDGREAGRRARQAGHGRSRRAFPAVAGVRAARPGGRFDRDCVGLWPHGCRQGGWEREGRHRSGRFQRQRFTNQRGPFLRHRRHRQRQPAGLQTGHDPGSSRHRHGRLGGDREAGGQAGA